MLLLCWYHVSTMENIDSTPCLLRFTAAALLPVLVLLSATGYLKRALNMTYGSGYRGFSGEGIKNPL